MRNNGLMTSGSGGSLSDKPVAVQRIGACLALVGLLMMGACASTDDSATEAPKTQAQQDLQDSSKELSQPLFADTEQEGTVVGALAGGLLSIGNDNARVSIPMGAVVGNLAGKYVAAKQEEYSEEVEVIEAMTRDIQTKNEEAQRTVKAMEVVVAEHRARLAELKKARGKDKGAERKLEQELAVAERDLATMKDAVKKAEGHLKTFSEAREIVLKDSDTRGLSDKPVMKKMDGEIEALRARIRAMNQFVSDLTNVG